MKGVCNIPHNIYTIMIKTHENENKVVIRHVCTVHEKRCAQSKLYMLSCVVLLCLSVVLCCLVFLSF